MVAPKLTLLLAIIACSVPLRAAASGGDSITVHQFLQEYDSLSESGQDVWNTAVLGIEEGFLWSNAYIVASRKEAPLYCQPDKLSLTPSQVIDMVRRDERDDQRVGELPLPAGVLAALQRAFPCREDNSLE